MKMKERIQALNTPNPQEPSTRDPVTPFEPEEDLLVEVESPVQADYLSG